MAKKFKDIREGDYVYYLSPANQKIKEVFVRGVFDTKSNKHRALKVYKNLTHISKKITVDLLDIAKEEHDSNIYQLIIVPLDADFVLLYNNKLPTVLSTSKEIIERWMAG